MALSQTCDTRTGCRAQARRRELMSRLVDRRLPGLNESAGISRCGRTRPDNSNLKRLLGLAAMAAIRNKDSYLATYFRRTSARQGGRIGPDFTSAAACRKTLASATRSRRSARSMAATSCSAGRAWRAAAGVRALCSRGVARGIGVDPRGTSGPNRLRRTRGAWAGWTPRPSSRSWIRPSEGIVEPGDEVGTDLFRGGERGGGRHAASLSHRSRRAGLRVWGGWLPPEGGAELGAGRRPGRSPRRSASGTGPVPLPGRLP